MVRAGKWLKSFLTGRKEKHQGRLIERSILLQLPPPPPPPPLPPPPPPPPPPPTTPNGESMRSFHLETVLLKQTPKDQLSPPSNSFFKPELSKAAAKRSSFSTIQQVAAIKIQACFRSFLARKALRALKGLVKLQAVVRGFLVRKEAAATIRSMQALLTVQVRARAQRVRMIEEVHSMQMKENNQRRRINESKFQQLYDKERNANKNGVETKTGQSKVSSKDKKSSPTTQTETRDRRLFNHKKSSLVPSVVASEMCSGTHEETETFFPTTRSSSQHSSPTLKPRRICSSEANSNQGSYLISQDCSFFPNYMANTESWKAKARSQSAPRQRNDFFDSKPTGKQRISIDGRNINRAIWDSPLSSAIAKEKIQWPEEFDKLVSNIDYYRFITA